MQSNGTSEMSSWKKVKNLLKEGVTESKDIAKQGGMSIRRVQQLKKAIGEWESSKNSFSPHEVDKGSHVVIHESVYVMSVRSKEIKNA